MWLLDNLRYEDQKFKRRGIDEGDQFRPLPAVSEPYAQSICPAPGWLSSVSSVQLVGA